MSGFLRIFLSLAANVLSVLFIFYNLSYAASDLEFGRIEYRNRNYMKAAEYLEKALKKGENSDEIRELLINCYLKLAGKMLAERNFSDETMDYLKRVLKLDEGNIEASLGLVTVYMSRKEYAGVIEVAQRLEKAGALLTEAEKVKLYEALMEIYDFRGDLIEASRYALELKSSSPKVETRKRAENILKKAFDGMEEIFRNIESSIDNGNFKEAEDRIISLEKSFGYDSATLQKISRLRETLLEKKRDARERELEAEGDRLLKAGKKREALEKFGSARSIASGEKRQELEEKVKMIEMELARQHAASVRKEEETARQSRDESMFNFFVENGDRAFEKGNFAEALEAYEKASKINSGGVIGEKIDRARRAIEGSHFLEQARKYLEAGDADSAYEKAKRALELMPKSTVLLETVGESSFLLEKWDEALDHYMALLELAPTAKVFSRVGDIYLEKKRPAEAIRYLEDGLKKTGAEVEFLERLGRACIMNNDREQAIKHYSRYTVLNPGAHRAKKVLADLYFEKGNMAEAYRYYSAYCNAAGYTLTDCPNFYISWFMVFAYVPLAIMMNVAGIVLYYRWFFA